MALESPTVQSVVPPVPTSPSWDTSNQDKPYSEAEILLILKQVPSFENARLLAIVLKRTQKAIQTIQALAYSGKWLKQTVEGKPATQDNVHIKVARIKKQLGIFIGHVPKSAVKPDGRGGFIVTIPD